MFKKEEKNASDSIAFAYNRDKHGIESQAISYAVCSRYGIELPKLDVVHPPEGKPQDLMKVLEGMDYSLQRISKLIEEGGIQQRRFLGQNEGANQKAEKMDHQPRDRIQA